MESSTNTGEVTGKGTRHTREKGGSETNIISEKVFVGRTPEGDVGKSESSPEWKRSFERDLEGAERGDQLRRETQYYPTKRHRGET